MLSFAVGVLGTSLGFAGVLEVSTSRKKENATPVKMKGDFHTSSEQVYYKVAVKNGPMKPFPPLTAKYIVFVERQKVGEKMGSEIIEKLTGTAQVGELPKGGKAEFQTLTITLNQTGLGNGYVAFTSGGRIRAQDSIKGIWIKFFDGDQEVDEYANPSTLTKRYVFNTKE